jgi:hypothetical protein
MKLTFGITLTAFFISFFLTASVFDNMDAMSWPDETAVLIRNFGSNDNGSPVLGMIFSGGNEILAAENGEVIFSRGVNDTASKLPSPFGAWTAVDHEDGLISIYSRYDKSADASMSLTKVEKSQPLASPGISGWSANNGFYFIIFDRKERHWINPAMIVTPVQRSRPPQILSVNFKNDQGLVMQSRNLSQGRYTILVNAVSPALSPLTRENSLVPHKIICSINGAGTGSLDFEAFSSRDGVLMIYRNGLVPARQVYSAFPAFEAVEVFLTRGQANLEIIVQDIEGNSSTMVTRLIVN